MCILTTNVQLVDCCISSAVFFFFFFFFFRIFCSSFLSDIRTVRPSCRDAWTNVCFSFAFAHHIRAGNLEAAALRWSGHGCCRFTGVVRKLQSHIPRQLPRVLSRVYRCQWTVKQTGDLGGSWQLAWQTDKLAICFETRFLCCLQKHESDLWLPPKTFQATELDVELLPGGAVRVGALFLEVLLK